VTYTVMHCISSGLLFGQSIEPAIQRIVVRCTNSDGASGAIALNDGWLGFNSFSSSRILNPYYCISSSSFSNCGCS
jgi:hypothetical protein